MTMRVEHKAETLAELLQVRAQRSPGDMAYGFLPEGEGDPVPITYGKLDTEARRIATQLSELLAPGSRALLVYEPGLGFITALFGCLYAGIVAVPVYPPMPGRMEAGLANLRLIASDCAAKAVLTQAHLRSYVENSTAAAPVPGITWIVTDQGGGDASAWRGPRIRPDAVALLQYTSGSTTDPRGVVLRHDTVLANQRAIQKALRVTSPIAVSWLPPYHDMGLFGFLLQPVYLHIPCYLMSPLHFLQRPGRWLRAITRFRATHSGGPPFGYELCARRVTEAEKESLDLSSWQVAAVGAEPIRSEGLARFAEAFASCGFRQASLYPCYGLAEATLLVTASVPGTLPVRMDVEPQALEKGVAKSPGAAGQGSKQLVSSGRAHDDHEVVIVDRSTTLPIADRMVGEVWVAGPSVADSYWDRPALSAETFGVALPGFPGRRFLRTGDLGFLADGYLYITGRIKELMIIHGRNILPQDVESIGQAADGRLRPGCGAAFALDDDTDRAALVQETTITDPQQAAELLPRIRQAVQERLGIVLRTIVLVPAHAVPKTSSGKVRRLHTRELLTTGRLPVIAGLGDRTGDDPTRLGPNR
jgi:acyl-CoA synthetase (AMP-forming)/AMP-acid ligase II